MEPVSTTLTAIEAISIINLAIKSGSKLAIEIMDIIERIKAGQSVPRDEFIGALQKIDADAVLKNSIINNPISLPKEGT